MYRFYAVQIVQAESLYTHTYYYRCVRHSLTFPLTPFLLCYFPLLHPPFYAQGRILMEKGSEKKEGGEERGGNAASKIKFWIWMTKKVNKTNKNNKQVLILFKT